MSSEKPARSRRFFEGKTITGKTIKKQNQIVLPEMVLPFYSY